MLKEKVGELYVNGYEPPFARIKINKALAGLHNKIIECRWGNDKWEFMRERLDKSYPNHMSTAIGLKHFFLTLTLILKYFMLVFNFFI